MNFADKLKELRKAKNLSQEQLAEKLYVSRQAITKWENGTGLPDIENIVAIAALFNESLDNLLSEEKSLLAKHEFLYESLTRYDLDEEKTIDINFGTAHEVILERTKDEKIEILVASNKMNYLSQQVKVKIEENKKRMDVVVKHSADLTDSTAKEFLYVFVKIPQRFVAHLELNGITENLRVRDINLNNLEFGGKFKYGFITNAEGHLEVDTNADVQVEVQGFRGKIDFNQLRATSVLRVAEGNYYLRRVGTRNRFVDENHNVIELSKSRRMDEIPSEEFKDYDFIVEIAGWKSELQICKK